MEKKEISSRILFVIIIGLAIVSLYFGLKNFVNAGVDSQIDGARMVARGTDPYGALFIDFHSFKYSRWPVLLPQGYLFLLPLTAFQDSVAFLVMGLFSILALVYLFRKDTSKESHRFVVLMLLFCTLSYRNNLGNGQIGVFLFPFFISFHRLIYKAKLSRGDIFLGGLLLLVLSSKPTLYFWIPFAYLIDRNKERITSFLKILAVYAVLQSLALLTFCQLVHAPPLDVMGEYIDVLHMMSRQMYDGASFLNINLIDHNYLVLLIIPLAAYFLFAKEVEARLFSAIVLSLLLVYHREYDLFIIAAPLLIYDQITFSEWLLLGLMIIEKGLIMIVGNGTYLPCYMISGGLVFVFAELLMTKFKQTPTT